MPLRLRLALWYGSLTGLILLLTGLVAYTLHSRAQYDALDRALMGAVEHVAGLHAGQPVSDELVAMLATPILPNVGVRLFTNDGALLTASPNALQAPSRDPRTLLAAPAGPAYDGIARRILPFATVPPGQGAFGLVTDAEGHRWRLYVLASPDNSGYFLAETTLREIDASVRGLRALLPLLVLVGAITTLAVGGWVAGRALQPVALLTEAAGAIARSRALDRRVPVGARQDELGQLALTFNEMLASLEQAVAAQQRFVADASHELRTPLTAIQANLELLGRGGGLPPDEAQAVAREALRESYRLSRLVADLLALAQADAGIALPREGVELDRVVLAAYQSAQVLDSHRRLRLDPFELVQVTGDADRLQQVLVILLDNALKYTPPDGYVTLGLQHSEGEARVIVRDTGVGISASELSHVFDRFYRTDPARRRNPGGSGLGLAIARWIVEQHGGQITLQSAPNVGTTVTVRLPSPPPRPSFGAGAASQRHGGKGTGAAGGLS